MPSLTLLSIPGLVACALILTPLLVKLLGRHAGWPIVAFFAAAIVQLFRLASSVFGGSPVEWSTRWAGSMLPGSSPMEPLLHDAPSPTSSSFMGLDFQFALKLDPLSFLFAAIALLVGSVVFVYSTAYLGGHDHGHNHDHGHVPAHGSPHANARSPHANARSYANANANAQSHASANADADAQLHELRGRAILRGTRKSRSNAIKNPQHAPTVTHVPKELQQPGDMSFYLLMTSFMLAVLLLVLANDVALLFVGWELVSMASFLLIARSGRSGELGSLRTLLLTFTGGLLVLSGLGIATLTTKTTNLTDLLHSPAWAEHQTALTVVAVLIAFGAFTKAAQFPFHAWLPEAMAAATPVSAFLHAAAVVKAGIYLLMRFSTLFADLRVWQLILLIAGMSTAVMTAYFALQQTDIKKLIAYSTVSQLGWIVATISVGTHFAIMAAAVHTIAHAMFKSSLFMLAGVVDHQTGTRDFRRLGNIWRQMPWTFGSMVIGAASMAAVPPTFGFISKEGMLETFTEAPLNNVGVAVLLFVAAIGALGTFLYSARLVFGAFVDGPREFKDLHEAPIALWLPAAIPGVLSLPAAFVAGSLLDAPLNRIVETVQSEPVYAYGETHLALWHGMSVPFWISVAVIVVGVIGVVFRKEVLGFFADRALFPFTGVDAINVGTHLARRTGRVLAKPAQSHQPSRHLLPLLGLLAVYALAVALWPGVGGEALRPKIDGIDRLEDLIPLVVVVIGVWATVSAKNRLQAAILLGVTGVGVTLQVLLLGAPDVALTQFMVEILTVVLMMLVLRLQPRAFHPTEKKRKIGAAVISLGVGVATFLAVWTLTGRRDLPEVAQWYLDNTEKVTGETNIVNVILVEFRAFDTMGELSVLGMAGIAIAAVVASMPRFPQLLDHPGPLAQPRTNAKLMGQLVRFLVPVMFVLSAFVLYRGGTSPGGGFNAALMGASTLMLHYLCRESDGPIMGKNGPYYLSAGGVILAIGTGFAGFFEGSFLAPIYGHFLGQHLTSALLFDVGVYFAVLGIIAAALNHLGGPTRPGSTKTDKELGEQIAQRTSLFAPEQVGVFANGEAEACPAGESESTPAGEAEADLATEAEADLAAKVDADSADTKEARK